MHPELHVPVLHWKLILLTLFRLKIIPIPVYCNIVSLYLSIYSSSYIKKKMIWHPDPRITEKEKIILAFQSEFHK